MQIFEITLPRKSLTEVSAAGAGLGSFASGLASTLGSSGGAAAGVAGAIGAAAQPTPGAGDSQSADIAGAKISQQMASALGPQLLKAWNTEVQKWMQTYEVPSVASANQTDQAALKGALKVLIDKTLNMRDYKQLPTVVADDPNTQAAAKQIVDTITTSIDAIFDVTAGTFKGNVKNEFVALASQGLGPAISMKQFNAGADQREQGRSPLGRTAPLTPDTQQMARQVGLNNNDIAELQAYFQRLDPNKATTILKNLAGLPP